MNETSSAANQSAELKPYLSPLAVWALSVGSAIGWGSLVVTSSTYLSQAGPLGSIIGLLIGFAMMLMVSSHYSYLASHFPGTGGLYHYVKNIFGYDRAFLIAWFMFLIYISIFWANATSIPLFARYFLHGIFKKWYLFTVFGYEVYLGEALMTLVMMWLVGLLCMKSKKMTAKAMVVMVLIFTVGITVCFAVSMIGFKNSGLTMAPAFVPETGALRQIIRIAFLSPWAFIGFESVSHSSAECDLKHRGMLRVLIISAGVTTALYIFVILMSISVYPEGCTSWLDYIRRLDEFDGLAGLPAFYAAQHYLGDTGVYILMASLLSLVLTSMIGMLRTLGRLCYAVAQDGILPERFALLNEKQIPVNALLLVLVVSLPVPFLGRTAIGWIVDTTTIGATIIYGFASVAVFKLSGREGAKVNRAISFVCLFILVAFMVYLLFPAFFSDHTLETATYVLMAVWSVIGLLYFNFVIRKDHARKFGKAIIVWLALLVFIVQVTLTWVDRTKELRENEIVEDIHQYFHVIMDREECVEEHLDFLDEQSGRLQNADKTSSLIITILFGLSFGALYVNYITQKRWEDKATAERDQARVAALIDPLTGVKSKHAFLLEQKKLDDAIKEKTTEPFSVAVCDVNGLKVINDTLGHKAGDEHIRKASVMICDIFQHSPVFRTGGDEFVVIMKGRDHLIRKELLLVLHDRSVEHISTGDVVISGGLSEFDPEHDHYFHDVFERADALMYEEKKLLKSLGSISREDAETPAAEAKEAPRRKPRVLIVDDTDADRECLGGILEDACKPLFAADGVEALEQIKACTEELSLVLLDLQMPHMSGLEVLQVLKEESELSEIPVIVMSEDPSAVADCLRLGAIDFILKPYPRAEVIQARVAHGIELAEERSVQCAERDKLTGLLSLPAFLRSVRAHDQEHMKRPMDAILLDINEFHMLNERYGKQYGDGVLARLGERVHRISRELGALSCRKNADTFYLYCPHQSDYDAILNKVAEGLESEDVSATRVRLRMGVYAEVDKSLQIERRFDRAKAAANAVKSGSATAIGVYDDKMHEAELLRQRLLEDFKPSLSSGRFKVYYQPKFDIQHEKPLLSSAEALVRWDHPELGIISPALFIPLLEDNGLILDLDYYVWRATAAQIRGWKDRFGVSVPICVNVSRVDMLAPNLKSVFNEILKEYDLDAKDLILEITESAYAGDSDQVIATAMDLRGMGMGFRIEMDDFGTGYSSLGTLSKLPIDALKLDMSFLRSAFRGTKDMRMIQLIIDIADYLHVPVVAEGVETEEQYLALKELGCDMAQGYYFSMPVPPEAFEKFLQELAEAEAHK